MAQETDNVVPAAGIRDVRRVGTFEILDEIGRGGMGIVYRARDTKLQRVVALKRPKPELLDRPDLRRRFMTEARSASKLMHPHITTVFEVFEEDGVPWLVMELIDGASLRSMLSDGDPLSCEEVMRHAEGLTDADSFEVRFKRAMVSACKEVIAVVDASKWGQVAAASFASMDQLDRVYTDGAAPPEMVQVLKAQGIHVHLVDSSHRSS